MSFASILTTAAEIIVAALLIWGLFHETELTKWEHAILRYVHWRFSAKGRRYRVSHRPPRHTAVHKASGATPPMRLYGGRPRGASAQTGAEESYKHVAGL